MAGCAQDDVYGIGFCRWLLDVLWRRALHLVNDPEYFKGATVLVLQKDRSGLPIHVVWGIPKGAVTPAVVVTGYRPQADKWSSDFKARL